jgi:hypothetical protein
VGEVVRPLVMETKGRGLANPFGLTGRIEDPAAYLVRRPLTDEILHELGKGVSLSIVGDSQTGKSSLLWYIKTAGPGVLKRRGNDFVHVSLEVIHSDDDFFEYICGKLEIPTSRGFRLGRALKDRQVILCLDEFEKMTWQGFTLALRSELRGLADGASTPFTLVIASRSPLGRLFPDSPEMTSPLAGLCMQVKLPPFSLGEAWALVEYRLTGSGVVIGEEVVERVWQEVEGHPGRFEQGMKEVFGRLMKKGGTQEGELG